MEEETKIIKKENNRELFYDILRIIAIFCVLYNHRPCYDIFTTNYTSIKGIICMILSIFSKCGPPLFFMISGALLLKKEESFKKIFLHRIVRIFAIMVIITLIFAIKYKWTIDIFISYLFSKHNWYLYSYLGYLFMLPLLRKIALHTSEKEMKNFIILCTIFYTISILFVVVFKNTSFSLLDNLQMYSSIWGSTCWNIVFPLLGYFTYSIISNHNYKSNFNIFVYIGTICSLILGVIFIIYDMNYNLGENFEQIRQHFIIFPSIFIFASIYYLTKRTENKINLNIKKVLGEISAATFGCYLIEVNMQQVSVGIYNYLYMRLSNIHIFWVSILSVIVEFIIYSLIIIIIRRIKFMRKLL